MTDRSDKFTIHSKKTEKFSDFITSFDKNPSTGYLAKVSDTDSIKQSLYNLIMTMRTERYYQPEIGCKIYSLLFDPIDKITEEQIRNEIKETILNNEPRVSLKQVIVEGNLDLNGYIVTIAYSEINRINHLLELSLILKRVR